jgi:hypothetical protein
VEAATVEDFQDIRHQGEPVVFKGLVADWPLVRAAAQDEALDYLKKIASDGPVQFMRAAPEIEGRLHYANGLQGRNFEPQRGPLIAFLDLLAAETREPRPAALVLQGMPARERLSAFAETHPMPLLPAAVTPRVWIGNAATVATHHDPSENIACVAAGRRRFTLFPPEAVGDLYMGPFHQTPAGVQVSLVHLTDPDLERFPRFARAIEVAQVAELEAGDALYIPYHWYHHVESLASFNVLVNYWWDPAQPGFGSPWDALMHGMMSLRALPPEQRRAWRAMFDHYVFETNGDPGAHLPSDARGILSAPTPRSAAQMARILREKLRRD